MSAGEAQLRLLAAELRAEHASIGRCVAEITAALEVLGGAASTLEIYGAAALLDSFYTGVERCLERIARSFDCMPLGPAWHRELLESSALTVPGVRPAVLGPSDVRELMEFLSFRHRFRHLYVFDLEPARLRPLLADAPRCWAGVEQRLVAFADALG